MLKICTSNRSKAAEISRILDVDGEAVSVALTEIQTLDPAVVSRAKASEAFAKLGVPVLVDDTGLSLEALNGFPGALVAWVLGSGGGELLHRMLPAGASARAIATTAIGYADLHGTEVFVGAVPGIISATPMGDQGFGFDTVFIPDGTNKTLAQMTAVEKDAISPRRLALDHLARFLAHRQSTVGI